MPVYDYRCNQCGALYDVYHKVKEVKEDVVCPSCFSQEHTRLMSVASVGVGRSNTDSAPCACEMGGECCGGGCSMN